MDTKNPRREGEGFGVNLAGDAQSHTTADHHAQTLKAKLTGICSDAMTMSLIAMRFDTIAECCRKLIDDCDGLSTQNLAVINRLAHLCDLTTVQALDLVAIAERVEMSSRSLAVQHG